ncbi:hypothetical protein KBA27_04325, partial [bacterium]|nr:hypothetical protein [bacterium]
EFTNNDDFNFDDLTSDNNNEFSDFDDILSDTKNEDDESSISFNDTADDVEYNIDNNSDDDEKISTDDYTNENKDSESDRFNISPDELPDFEDLPDFSENEIAEDVEIEENTENILENTDENTDEIESESTDLPISDTTEEIKSGDEQDKEIENTEIPEQEIPTDTTSESNIGNIDFDNIDDLDEQISAEATPESDITESSDIENDLFSETKDLISQIDENVEDVEDVEDIKDAEEAQTTEPQTEFNDINNFNEESENTKAEEIETSQADISTSETNNEENVDFDSETINQDDEDTFTSKLPEIDFGSISNDAEQNFGDTEPEIIEEKIEDKSSSSDDDELSPVEQLESNPDAVEALKSKIKDKQIANMPNYFSNLQETADDTDELDENNEELENNELREDSSNSNNEEENNVSEITDSETALPELNLEEVPELKENEEGLVSLNAFDELPETNAVSEEEKPKEDVVSLDNFDFDMFEKKVEEEGPVKVDLPNKDNTPNAEPTEIENTNSDNVNETMPNEATASDSIDDLDSAIEDNEVADITSQVDAFLNEVDLDDEQKDILSTEVNIDESLLSTDVPNIDESIEELPTTEEEETTTTNPTEVSETTAFPTETGLISEPVNEYQTEAIGDETHAEYGEAEPETLEYLFNKDKESEDEIELEETEPIGKKAFLKDKKMVTAAIVCAIFATMTITTVIKNVNQPKDAVFPKDMNSQENVVPTAPNGMTPAGTPAGDAQNPNVPGAIGTTNGGTVANQPPQDMGKAVSNAFTTQAINAQVSKIAWEVPESLSYSVGFRRYLQTAGKNLKLSLQSDLLLATEMAYSNKCVIDVVVSNSGNIQSLGLITSSGSKQIDNIVLQSVKETLNYLKAPANELNGKSADLTLIINF